MVFVRPSSLPVPTIWHRFTVQRGSSAINLRVQDLTPNLVEPAVALIDKYFTRDEPPCKYIGIQNHPAARAELNKMWRDTIKDNFSVVCVKDEDCDSPDLIGVNILTVACKEDKDEPFKSDNPIWAMLFGAVHEVSHTVDIFKYYQIDKYLTAVGMVVDPEWRGMAIGKEILKARIPLCKALNIKVTATVFTAAASQAVAQKAGFVTLADVSYSELAERGFKFPGIEEHTKSSKLMALLI